MWQSFYLCCDKVGNGKACPQGHAFWFVFWDPVCSSHRGTSFENTLLVIESKNLSKRLGAFPDKRWGMFLHLVCVMGRKRQAPSLGRHLTFDHTTCMGFSELPVQEGCPGIATTEAWKWSKDISFGFLCLSSRRVENLFLVIMTGASG